MSKRLLVLPIVALTTLAVVAAACGGGEEEATPTRTPASSPAATVTVPAAGTPTGETEQLEVTAEGIAFDTTSLQVVAGEPFTIKLENKDGVPHNLHIYAEGGGDSIAVTEPDRVSGGSSGVLSTIIDQPGEYYFQCDFHPAVMTGKITVTAR